MIFLPIIEMDEGKYTPLLYLILKALLPLKKKKKSKEKKSPFPSSSNTGSREHSQYHQATKCQSSVFMAGKLCTKLGRSER